jgi:lipopolysaccharide export system permease protein
MFFIIIDYLSVARKLPSSANLKILYIYYKFLQAVGVLTPISLVFGMILTLVKLVKENLMVAFYSLGYSKISILSPFFVIAMLITIFYISLHTTDFAYSREFAKDIKKGRLVAKNRSDLFFKYDSHTKSGEIKHYYIFFSKLYPTQKFAEGIRIFDVKNSGELAEIIRAKYAYYDNKNWIIFSARFLKISEVLELNKRGIEVRDREKLVILKGFKPTILDQIYEGKIDFGLADLFQAISLLNEQGFNIDKLKTSLFNIVIHPLFAPLLMVIIFFSMPISSRMKNLSLIAFGSVLLTLLLWGVLLAFVQLSFSGTLIPEFAIIFPILFLAITSLLMVNFNR